MTSDDETLGVYAAQADVYAKNFSKAEPDPLLTDFIAAVAEGGAVLDLGCGPGDAARAMEDAGLRVDAVDASPEMARVAKEMYDIDVWVDGFDSIEEVDDYDGVWANFSLLHAPKAEMPGHLERLHRAMRSGGVFHLALKQGDGEKRDKLGRFYAFYQQDELSELLEAAGFTVGDWSFGEGAGLAGTVDPWMAVTSRA
jgi:SAM-dependent methyltransferase